MWRVKEFAATSHKQRKTSNLTEGLAGLLVKSAKESAYLQEKNRIDKKFFDFFYFLILTNGFFFRYI